MRGFQDDRAKKRTQEAVAALEAQTAAEIVVALRNTSGHYRHTDYLVGAGCGLLVLLAMLFLPQEFALWAFAPGVALAFAAGTYGSAATPTLRRLLTSGALLRDNVLRSAKATFVDLGIARVRARTGILVYLSIFEGRVELVADVGVRTAVRAEELEAATARLRAALVPRPDFDAFLAALGSLGPVLAQALPRAADDENELPDEVAS